MASLNTVDSQPSSVLWASSDVPQALPDLACVARELDPAVAQRALNPGAWAGEVVASAGPGRVAIGVGCAWQARWSEPPATGALDALCLAWLERLPQAPAGSPATLPWIWGGRAFFDRRPQAPWAGWPAAELRIPRHLIYDWDGKVGVLSFVDEPLPTLLPGARRSSAAEASETPLPGREPWIALAASARDAVVEGRLNKLVPARVTGYALPTGSRYALERVWSALGGAPGTRYAWSVGEQTFVGRTPEQLIAVEGPAARTVALAGAAPRGDDAEADRALGEALLADPKIHDEHQSVVRGIRARLEAAGMQVEPAPAPRLLRLAEAQHVETPLRAAREGSGLWSLVDALHPTPALAGAPQAEATRWLLERERLARGWFGAPLGWVDRQGDGAAWVAIRGALVERHTAWAFAGAGVVAGSDPAAEWTETELKLTAMASALEAARVEDL